jgi:cysteinyl-tRNA synthetase
MYTCGLTVNDYMHIGNARVYLVWDVVKRYLEYSGYKVLHVSNVTDIAVEDRIIREIKALGVSFQKFIEDYTRFYFEDRTSLGIARADVHPLATQHVQQMIELIEKLVKKGYAYTAEDGVYYSISKFPSYGKLSGIDPKALKAGAGGRVSAEDYSKESAGDFSLWKSVKPDEPYWYSPWGKGRPGWHIECSAMSMQYLGESFDIHAGGEDNIFPHHENEIAQSEAASGKPFVKYWLHTRHLFLNGRRMSKSLKNYMTVREAVPKYGAALIRFFIVSTHYRSQMDFNETDLKAAEPRLERFIEAVILMHSLANEGIKATRDESQLTNALETARTGFQEAMDDDFNTSLAITNLLEFIREVNRNLETEKTVSSETAAKIYAFLEATGHILLGELFEREVLVTVPDAVTALVKTLLDEREKARQSGNYALGDSIRDKLVKAGIEVQDTKTGSLWRLKSKAQ